MLPLSPVQTDTDECDEHFASNLLTCFKAVGLVTVYGDATGTEDALSKAPYGHKNLGIKEGFVAVASVIVGLDTSGATVPEGRGNPALSDTAIQRTPQGNISPVDGALSSDAILGITIAAVVATALLIAFFVCRSKRRRRRQGDKLDEDFLEADDDTTEHEWDDPESPMVVSVGSDTSVEIDGDLSLIGEVEVKTEYGGSVVSLGSGFTRRNGKMKTVQKKSMSNTTQMMDERDFAVVDGDTIEIQASQSWRT